MTGLLNAVSTSTTALRARLRAFAGDQRGAFAMWLAALVPGISVLAVGAMELGKVSADRSRLQDAADVAALTGAQQLAVGATGAAERAKATALAQLHDIAAQSRSLGVTAELGPGGNSVVVTIRANRTSFFHNLLPPGGFTTLARAEAAGMTREPMCVIGLDDAKQSIPIYMAMSAGLTANCIIHSNRDIYIASSSRLSGKAVHSVGTATGAITPTARTGAERVEDPFAKRAITIPTCTAAQMQEVNIQTGVLELAPGAHCGDWEASGTAEIRLRPGAHYFIGAGGKAGDGKLSMKGLSRLTGTDVTLFFGATSKLYVFETAKLDLKAPRTGANAGMVMVSSRDNNKAFLLASPAVDRLEGVVYIPEATLFVDGSGQMVEQSKWTIMVAKALRVTRGAQLVVKTDYASSEVPVPSEANVGTSGGGAHLVK